MSATITNDSLPTKLQLLRPEASKIGNENWDTEHIQTVSELDRCWFMYIPRIVPGTSSENNTSAGDNRYIKVRLFRRFKDLDFNNIQLLKKSNFWHAKDMEDYPHSFNHLNLTNNLSEATHVAVMPATRGIRSSAKINWFEELLVPSEFNDYHNKYNNWMTKSEFDRLKIIHDKKPTRKNSFTISDPNTGKPLDVPEKPSSETPTQPPPKIPDVVVTPTLESEVIALQNILKEQHLSNKIHQVETQKIVRDGLSNMLELMSKIDQGMVEIGDIGRVSQTYLLNMSTDTANILKTNRAILDLLKKFREANPNYFTIQGGENTGRE